jgi:hypothetical protein
LPKRVLLFAFVAVALAACNGGTVDRHALTNDSATLDSIACEGALLAHEIAHGKTTAYFAREQAEELRIESSNLADALTSRHALTSIAPRVRAKGRHAATLAEALQRLHDHPSDRADASTAEQRLKKLGGCV